MYVFLYVSSNDKYLVNNEEVSKDNYLQKLNDQTAQMIAIEYLDVEKIKEILEQE